MKKNLFFVDAETDGLYGSFLTVGIIVTDSNCLELERHYLGIQRDGMNITDSWAKEHVLPILGNYEECSNEDELLERVWNCWEKYSESAYAIADVCYPVEARLFERCVRRKLPDRAFRGPFPLLDLSSLLFAKDIDPLTQRLELLEKAEEPKQHNALYDAEMSVKLFEKYILKRGGEEWK